MRQQNTNTVKITISALLLAVAYLLPFLTGQIKSFGAMLCPMHLPVILCGFLCGWPWGVAVGVTAPLLRSATLGMPLFFPSAVCMAVELAVYAAVSGILYRLLPRKKGYIYVSLLTAMIVGRLVWGCVMWLCLSLRGSAFTLAAFFAGAVGNALPGIAVQILLIPPLVMLFERLGRQK